MYKERKSDASDAPCARIIQHAASKYGFDFTVLPWSLGKALHAKKLPYAYHASYNCENVGHFPDVHNCKRFYQCNIFFGLPFVQNVYECENNLVFSINTETCVTPEQSGRSECRERDAPPAKRKPQPSASLQEPLKKTKAPTKAKLKPTPTPKPQSQTSRKPLKKTAIPPLPQPSPSSSPPSPKPQPEPQPLDSLISQPPQDPLTPAELQPKDESKPGPKPETSLLSVTEPLAQWHQGIVIFTIYVSRWMHIFLSYHPYVSCSDCNNHLYRYKKKLSVCRRVRNN